MAKALCQHSRFTLLELLVATMAGAVLMAALLAALSGAWRLQEQGDLREQAEAPRRSVRQRLFQELSLAVPPSELLAGAFTAIAEESGEGRQDDIEWVTAVGARGPERPEGDLVRVHYYLSENGDGDMRQLVRTENRHLLAVAAEEPEEVVVLEDVVSFEADWYDGESWVTGWDSTVQENRLPQAARIRIEFAGGATGTSPRPLTLVVPLAMRTLSAEEGRP
jgi:type II secretory pathway component PulJ